MLDACYRTDGVEYGRKNVDPKESFIPSRQVAWLKHDLSKTRLPTVVLVHQLLDGDPAACILTVTNSAHIRRVLDEFKVVKAVFQGHHHENHCHTVEGIHYVTFNAMVDEDDPLGGAYAIVELARDHINIKGCGRQCDWKNLRFRNS